MDLENAELLVDGLYGVYVPKRFVMRNNPADWHIDPEDAEVLLAGPDHENYWEVWNDVLDNAFFVDDSGRRWTLYQEEDDLLSVCDDMDVSSDLDEIRPENALDDEDFMPETDRRSGPSL